MDFHKFDQGAVGILNIGEMAGSETHVEVAIARTTIDREWMAK